MNSRDFASASCIVSPSSKGAIISGVTKKLEYNHVYMKNLNKWWEIQQYC